MKTIKFLLTSLVVMAVLTLSASRVTEPAKSELSANFEAVKQCGVSNAQITLYLTGGHHHHTVYWVQDIPGTCNSRAGIEGCSTATVYVVDGSIVGHLDSQGYCD
ncbi:MAG: hypothetical protein EPN85_05555 [Bacteroidetes bacterium]|nr:MAG: hypothetical protein EPN85_05555 [Bacteroidota bacterium]